MVSGSVFICRVDNRTSLHNHFLSTYCAPASPPPAPVISQWREGLTAMASMTTMHCRRPTVVGQGRRASRRRCPLFGQSLGGWSTQGEEAGGVTHLSEQAGGPGSTVEEVTEEVTVVGTDSVAALWGEKRKDILSSEDSASRALGQPEGDSHFTGEKAEAQGNGRASPRS